MTREEFHYTVRDLPMTLKDMLVATSVHNPAMSRAN